MSRKQGLSHTYCTGERGLLVAIITTAANDLMSSNLAERLDSILFFTGGWYVQILQLLDMPTSYLPLEIEKCLTQTTP